jgi:hypothetical protein
MSYVHARSLLCCLAISLAAAGCTVASPRGTPVPLAAQLLPADARALTYGSTASEVLQNPAIGDKIRALFGPDWMPATSAGGQVALGAAAYFDQGGPVGMLRIGGSDYIAVSGCVPATCDSRHMLLLIEDGGSRLLARLDEGGFVHYYGYGSEGVMKDTAPLIVDSGLRALYRSGNPYPSARS